MRTTVTLDSDVARLLAQEMARRKISFKGAVNDAIRRGLAAPAAAEWGFPTYDLGHTQQDLVKAADLAAALDDERIGARLDEGR